MSIPSDQRAGLLVDAVRGDQAALQQLLLLSFPFIEMVVRSQFNAQLAENVEVDDLIQEVLIKIHRGIASYQDYSLDAFDGWIRTIVGNCVIDTARRYQRVKRGGEVRRVRRHPVEADQSLDTIMDWVVGDSPKPDGSMRRKEARQAIQICLSNLPTAQRDAVMAHYFEHLDVNEIAARFNRTPGAIRELLRRARERLAELMGTASTWLSQR